MWGNTMHRPILLVLGVIEDQFSQERQAHMLRMAIHSEGKMTDQRWKWYWSRRGTRTVFPVGPCSLGWPFTRTYGSHLQDGKSWCFSYRWRSFYNSLIRLICNFVIWLICNSYLFLSYVSLSTCYGNLLILVVKQYMYDVHISLLVQIV